MTLSFLDMNYCRLKSRRQYVHLVPLITWPNIISELFEKAWETREFMPCSISSHPPATEWGGEVFLRSKSTEHHRSQFPTCRAVDIETMKRLHDKVNIFPQTSWQRRLVKVVLIKWFFATFGRLPIALFEVQVNLIPLIGKADSFTKEELQEFKQNVFFSSFPRILR